MRHAPLALTALLLAGLAAAESTPISLDQAMAHPDWIGPPVEQAWWRWDGQAAHYTLKRSGEVIRDTYSLSLSDAASARLDDSQLAGLDAAAPVFDRARSKMAFVRNGDVFLRDLRSGALQQISRGNAGADNLMFAADDASLLWQNGSDWYRGVPGLAPTPAALPRAEKDPADPGKPDALAAHTLRLSSTLQREKAQREAQRVEAERLRRADPTRAPAPSYLGDDLRIAASALSPSGRWLLVVTEPKTVDAGRVGKMPKYVTESGYEEVEDVRVRVGRNPPVGQGLRLIDLDSGKVVTLGTDALPGIDRDPLAELRKAAGKDALSGARATRVMAMQWNAAGDRVAVQLRAVDNKDRWLTVVDFDKGALTSVHRLQDPAWINWNFNDFGWLRDDRTLWLLSEESGYSHLYTLSPGGKPKALTAGRWEASSPRLSADGQRFYFLCNRQWPGDYEVCAKDIGAGDVRELSSLDRVEDFVESPDGRQLLLRWSSSYTPPQLAVMSASGGDARRLTDTRSDDYKARQWIAPQYVRVPSKHGAGEIWGKLYRPAQLEAGKRYPIALFVHGAGYLQNVHAGFPVYFREQMFHNLLVQQGYIVLDLDYRASEGYGRDWRTAIYRQMGHPELEDYLDGVDWLVDTQQGDRDRVGIYGGSYGGFMAFMALFRAPEVFHAGAALRPVTDWTSYNHEYTSNILNTPDIDPEAFKRSSPIEYADNLRGHLLISHGMIDDNVLYQDSVRLAQRLIELKKDHWELASYPLERHAYQHPESWYDQYRRIYQLFERSLK
ncbi:MAG TPA: S9 family peptidase [Arenimonas sp.]|nr:S9 family peptidase [Arenimonas sp.]